MDAQSKWAIVFGSAEGSRLARAAELVAAVPRLCRGELRGCDLGYSSAGRVLLAVFFFDGGDPTPEVRERLEFWVHNENGRAVALPRGGDDSHEPLLGLCEAVVRGALPANLCTALGELLGVDVVPARHCTMILDLQADGSGLALEGGVHKLFVPTPVPLPVGDPLAVQVVTEDGSRTCEARVLEWREPGRESATASAGLVVELVTPSSDLLATLAARLGRTLRRSPRYDVHLPARIEFDDEPARVRLEYASESQFASDYVENLSQGGAYVRTDRPLEAGARFELEIVLPSGEPLGLPAVVVHAREDGMGVRFELDAAGEARLCAAIADLARRQRRALVVDDNAFARKLLRDALAERGFTVAEASDGDAALRLLLDQLFAVDVVVADVLMPGMSGDALANEIRLHSGARPALVLASGRVDDDLRARVTRCGADRLVDKCLGPEQVAKEALEVVERAAS
jgi:uncharacterized protein (TIGR02266 family)